MQHADAEAGVAVGHADMRTALQPLNRPLPADRINSSGSNSKEAAAAGQSGAPHGRGHKPVGREQQQQQQQAEPDMEPDVAGSVGEPASILSWSAAQALLQGVLEGVSSGLSEALRQLSSSNSSCTAAAVMNINNKARGGSRGSTAWGPFELQRRSCAVAAMLLHSKQVLLLQLLHDRQMTGGAPVALGPCSRCAAVCPGGGHGMQAFHLTEATDNESMI